FIMKLGSIFASAAGSSGGNSTTRIAVPLSGGDRPMGLAALSSLNENPGGEESVIHRFAAGMPDRPGLSVRRLSDSATALLLASRPVTTRRISAAAAAEHANTTTTIEQNALRIIASLPCIARTTPALGRACGCSPVALNDAGRDRHACSSMWSCLPKW